MANQAQDSRLKRWMQEERKCCTKNVPAVQEFFSVVFRRFFVYTVMTQGFCTAFQRAPEPGKLSQLRAKTDLQLHDLLHSKLELGLNFATLAEVEESAGDRAHAERSLGLANQALVEVQRLLPVLSDDQRRGFGPVLNDLQAALDRVGRNLERPQHGFDVLTALPANAPNHAKYKL